MIFPRPCAWPGYCKRVAWWLWSPYCRVHRFELRLFLKDDAAVGPVFAVLLMIALLAALGGFVWYNVSGMAGVPPCS